LNYHISSDFLIDPGRSYINEKSVWNKILAYKFNEMLIQECVNISELYNNKHNLKSDNLSENTYSLLPQFMSLIVNTENGIDKLQKFFHRSITTRFIDNLKERKIIPGWNTDKEKIELFEPQKTVFFWPRGGKLGNKIDSYETPRRYKELITDIQELFDYNDFMYIKETCKKNDDKTYPNRKFQIKIKENYFVPIYFIKEFSSPFFKTTYKRNALGMQKISNMLIESNKDVISLMGLSEWIKTKKKNINWFIKFYSYLNTFKFTDNQRGDISELEIFLNESNTLHNASINLNEEEYKKDYKDLGIDINFININISKWEKFDDLKLYREITGKRHRKDHLEKNEISKGNYYNNCKEFITKYIDKVNRKTLLKEIQKYYNNVNNRIRNGKDRKEIIKTNISHIKIIRKIFNESDFNPDLEGQDDEGDGEFSIKLLSKDNGFKDCRKLLFTKKYYEKYKSEINEREGYILKNCAIIDEVYDDYMKIKKSKKLLFISDEYLDKNQFYFELLETLIKIGVGKKKLDDLNNYNKDKYKKIRGKIGEAIVKKLIKKAHTKSFVYNLNEYFNNYPGYDLILTDKSFNFKGDEKKDIEDKIANEDINKIEVKTTKSENKVFISGKQLNNFKNSFKEQSGTFELWIIRNMFKKDKDLEHINIISDRFDELSREKVQNTTGGKYESRRVSFTIPQNIDIFKEGIKEKNKTYDSLIE